MWPATTGKCDMMMQKILQTDDAYNLNSVMLCGEFCAALEV